MNEATAEEGNLHFTLDCQGVTELGGEVLEDSTKQKEDLNGRDETGTAEQSMLLSTRDQHNGETKGAVKSPLNGW